MKKLPDFFSGRFAPVFLLLIAVLGFGLLLPWLGFYWDDWAKMLVARLWGMPAYFLYYAEDRPLSAWTHIAFTPLLGHSPLPWHIFTLLLRWISAWGAWWCLNLIWPRARRPNLAAALAFLVHPVFVSQPAAVTFHQQWLQYALFFLSFGLMLSAQGAETRRARLLLTGGALLAMLAQLSVTEYFVPLELLRPVALWFLLDRERSSANPSFSKSRPGGSLNLPVSRNPDPNDFPGKQLSSRANTHRITFRMPGKETFRVYSSTLGDVMKAWAPYLLLLTGYVAWRLFFLRLTGADPYRAEMLYAFLQAPLATLRQVSWVALVDEMHILLNAWAALLNIQITHLTPFEILSYGVGIMAAVFTAVYLAFFQDGSTPGGAQVSGADAGTERRWLRQAFVLGAAAVLLGPVPAWITGRQVVFDFHSDRYAMPAMFGGGLLLAVMIEWLAQKRLQRAVLAGVLVGLAVAMNLRVANDYRWIWTAEQRMFWELSWRAPGLKAPTALFFEKEPFPNQGLFSTSAALNLMYPQPRRTESLAYWIYTLRPRYHSAPSSPLIGLNTTFRTLHFEGQTPDSLLLYNERTFSNCLWVLSARDASHPYLPELVKAFLPISNLSRIDAAGDQPGYPPADMIGSEPPRTGWCYFFEKADLARQQGDWAAAAGLYDEAAAQGYTPNQSGSNSPYEWLPFIEGLGRAGRWDEAARLTLQAYQCDANYRGMLCELWSGSLAQPDGSRAAGVLSELACLK